MGNSRLNEWHARLKRIEDSINDESLPRFLQYPLPLIDNPLPRKRNILNGAPYFESYGKKYRVMVSGSKAFGLPYGCISRILIAYSTTLMKMQASRVIKLASNQSELLALFGYISTSGGKRGIQSRLSIGINTLVRTVIQFEEISRITTKESKIYNGPFEYIESYTNSGRFQKYKNEVVLTHSESYYNFCMDHGTIPIDSKTFLAFSNSTYCLDFYIYLSHKATSAPKKGLIISWLDLAKIFDTTSQRPNSTNVRNRLNKYLPRIQYFWSKLEIEVSHSGLHIYASTPHVTRKAVDNSVC